MNPIPPGDDPDPFESVLQKVLADFATWLRANAPMVDEQETVSDAGVAMRWKAESGGGRAGSWEVSDIDGLLLGWCPRQWSVPADEADSLPVSLGLMLKWLDRSGGLESSERLGVLIEAAHSAMPEFTAAMADRGSWGASKCLVMAMLDDGLDPTDPADLAKWTDWYNSLSEAERREIVPDSAVQASSVVGDSKVTAAAVPVSATDPRHDQGSAAEAGTGYELDLTGLAVSASELARHRKRVPVLAKFRAMLSYLSQGKPRVTGKGNLKLADARELIERCDTGDVMDEVIGDQRFKTMSSVELTHLDRLFRWAKAAGLLRVSRGRLLVTEAGRRLADGRPLEEEQYDRIVDALLEIGPAYSLSSPDQIGAWPEGAEFVDSGAYFLLARANTAERSGVPVGLLADTMLAASRRAFGFPEDTETDTEDLWLLSCLDDLLKSFELAGLIKRHGVAPTDDVRRRVTPTGRVSLTPGGKATLTRLGPELAD